MVDEGVAIDALVVGGGEFAEFFVNAGEVFAKFGEFFEVEFGAARVAFEQGEHAEGVGLGGAVGEGGDGCLDDVHTGVDGGEVGGGA